MVRTRSAAAGLIESGHVRINGVRVLAPGHAVRLGDAVTVALDRTVRVLKVVAFRERRGGASDATATYHDLTAHHAPQGMTPADDTRRTMPS